MAIALGEGIGEQIEAAPQAVYDHARLRHSQWAATA
jgi:hypothetical protein